MRPLVQAVAFCALATAVMSACAGNQHYTPVELDHPRSATVFSSRRLDDAGLLAFLKVHGAQSIGAGWDARQLALVALYNRPDLQVGRATVGVARAAEITAGAGPTSSVQATVERASRVEEGKSSPWTVSLTGGLTLETGGKRAARIDRAKAATLASTLKLQADAWRVAAEAQTATVAAVAAERDLAAAGAIVVEEREVVALIRARYVAGEISATDLSRATTEFQNVMVEETAATQVRADARIALSRTLSIPYSQLAALPLRPEMPDHCTSLGAAPSDSLLALALNQRYDLGASLAEYAGAEADLRLAMAQQYPDVTIGPGLAWDQGITRWIISAGLQGIPAQRNRGPIAEADARRRLQVANASLAQQRVVVSVDSAIAACQSVGRSLAAANSLVLATERELDREQAAYERGETGKAEVALTRLALARARRVRAQTIARHAIAGMSLESALGAWVGSTTITWPDVTAQPGSTND